mmetsp:Transcript_36091/g.71523  ORF Transcript_36091/g.71523 Transcript_36091/m.71523 type:complete len:110 (+) Transcript_36091:283-612(+)
MLIMLGVESAAQHSVKLWFSSSFLGAASRPDAIKRHKATAVTCTVVPVTELRRPVSDSRRGMSRAIVVAIINDGMLYQAHCNFFLYPPSPSSTFPAASFFNSSKKPGWR